MRLRRLYTNEYPRISCEIAHDGGLCTFINRSASDRGQVVWSFRAGGMDRPSRTEKGADIQCY
jgi:hypothetical protein